MSTGLLFDCDEMVAKKAFEQYGALPFKFDRAIGLVTPGPVLQGAVFFTNYNGSNVELSYYGKNTATAGVIRCLARFIIHAFNPSRLTVVTSKRNRHYIRAFQKLGFKVEGIQRCYYGARDCQRHTGVRFVMFRDMIDKIAQVDKMLKAN